MSRKLFTNGGLPSPGVGGNNFVPGHWRADQSSGKIAIPEGPAEPIDRPEYNTRTKRAQWAVEQTAANLAEHSAAITPRRFSWEEGE